MICPIDTIREMLYSQSKLHITPSLFRKTIFKKLNQPSSDWGSHSPPALPHRLQQLAACFIQNGRLGPKVGPTIGYWTLLLFLLYKFFDSIIPALRTSKIQYSQNFNFHEISLLILSKCSVSFEMNQTTLVFGLQAHMRLCNVLHISHTSPFEVEQNCYFSLRMYQLSVYLFNYVC